MKKFIWINIDGFVKSLKSSLDVILAKAGIQFFQIVLDTCLRRHDGVSDFLRVCQFLFFSFQVIKNQSLRHDLIAHLKRYCRLCMPNLTAVWVCQQWRLDPCFLIKRARRSALIYRFIITDKAQFVLIKMVFKKNVFDKYSLKCFIYYIKLCALEGS